MRLKTEIFGGCISMSSRVTVAVTSYANTADQVSRVHNHGRLLISENHGVCCTMTHVFLQECGLPKLVRNSVTQCQAEQLTHTYSVDPQADPCHDLQLAHGSSIFITDQYWTPSC